jgi:mannose-6-phosphate isomerase-like protein (cupin superfamily)
MHRTAFLMAGLLLAVRPALGQALREHRRVVTGHSSDGLSTVVDDALVARVIRFETAPGYELTQLWATRADRSRDATGEDPQRAEWSFLPGPGETRFLLVRFPAATEINSMEGGFDPAIFFEEFSARVPDLAASLDDPETGSHTTDTLDYLVVVSGEIVLALDDGSRIELSPGDVVVQNGTRHTWINIGDEAAVLAGFMIGNQP